jgi:nucleoside-diphosphate-sugar epimerase
MDRHEIFGLLRRLPDKVALPAVHWIVDDLTRPLFYAGLPKNLDVIIHLAQSKSYKLFPEGAKDIFDVNIQSTFRLLEYAREAGVKCFILASSGGMYGYSYEKFVETDPVSPLNFYLSSKHTAELMTANYKQFFRTVVFRFFFVYGPGQQNMLIPNLLKKVLDGETIIIEGNPGLRINPIYVEDAMRVFKPALHLQTSDLFNVAGDENVTITDLVKLIEKVSGKNAIIKYLSRDPQGDLIGDNTRMKEVLGVYPRTSLLEGLSNML